MKPKPNILIFLVDQLQFDSTQAESQCQMPALERFKQEAMSFTNAYTCSPHCCPSRATLMTGVYPSRHSVFNNVDTDTAHSFGLREGVRTFSEDLVKAGYQCSYAGKYHMSKLETPKDRHWKELTQFDGYNHPFSSKPLNPLTGWNNWMESSHVQDSPSGQRPTGAVQRPGWGDIGPLKRVSGEDAIEKEWWYEHAIAPGIEEIKRLGGEEAPWCVCISDDMSTDSDIPKELFDLYDVDQVTLPDSFDDDFSDKPNIYRRMRETMRGQLSLKEQKEYIAHYWASCTLQDRYFEQILNALEESGQADDTMVIFVSDHGEYNGAHGLDDMNIPCFREAYQIPMIIRMPKEMRLRTKENDQFVSIADIAPTLADLVGVACEDEKTGRSILPQLKGERPENWRDALFTQTDGNETYFMQRSVMTKKWKYVYNAFDFDELYDRENDPSEMDNLIHPSKHAQPSIGSVERQNTSQPWPYLSVELDAVRKEMMKRIWTFALKEKDHIFFPGQMASYGPGMVNES